MSDNCRRRGLANRRRWVMGVAMGAVVLSGAGTAAAQLVKSPAQAAADSGPPPKSVLTAPVERRVLKDSVITRGTVTSEQSVDVMPSAKGETSGAPLVTKTPVVAGAPVEHGTVLIEVSGRPVFALKGKLPAYRDMKPGMEGEDVAQLQTALGALGHGTGGDRSGSFGEGTKTALAAFYEGIGYDPVEAQPDGGISLRDARTAVTEAERRLQDARDALDEPGETKPGEGDQKPKALRKQVTRAQDDVEQARRALTEARAVSGPMLPASEVVFLSGFPARVDSLAVRVGSPATGRALTVSAGSLVVNGYLQAHQKSLVRPGQRVEILSELSGVKGAARVASVADRVTQAPAEGEETGGVARPAGPQGYLMVVKPEAGLDPSLAGQSVRLTVEAASTGHEVLVVPVSAISSGADGKTSVQVEESDGSRRRVHVAVGATGDGHVEVGVLPGSSLRENERVVTGLGAGRGSEGAR